MRLFYILILFSFPALADNQSACNILLTNNNTLQVSVTAMARQRDSNNISNKPTLLESYVMPTRRFYKLEVTYKGRETSEIILAYTKGITYEYFEIKSGDKELLSAMEYAKNINQYLLKEFEKNGPGVPLPNGAVIVDSFVYEIIGAPPVGAVFWNVKVYYVYRLLDGSIKTAIDSPLKVTLPLDQRAAAQ